MNRQIKYCKYHIIFSVDLKAHLNRRFYTLHSITSHHAETSMIIPMKEILVRGSDSALTILILWSQLAAMHAKPIYKMTEIR